MLGFTRSEYSYLRKKLVWPWKEWKLGWFGHKYRFERLVCQATQRFLDSISGVFSSWSVLHGVKNSMSGFKTFIILIHLKSYPKHLGNDWKCRSGELHDLIYFLTGVLTFTSNKTSCDLQAFAQQSIGVLREIKSRNMKSCRVLCQWIRAQSTALWFCGLLPAPIYHQ